MFEARAVIFEARSPIWTISGMVVILIEKSAFEDPPPRGVHGPTFCGLARWLFFRGFWFLDFDFEPENGQIVPAVAG